MSPRRTFRFHLATISAGFALVALPLPAQAGTDGVDGTSFLPRAELAARHYGADAPWFERNIPFFDCSDAELTRVYYYRWQLYQAHLKDLGAHGYIVTEFLDDVNWACKPYQSLDDATAFHIAEGRWLRDRRYVSDYIAFMSSGPNKRHFTDAIAAAVYDHYLVSADRAFALRQLPGLRRRFDSWLDHYDATKGLYFIEPLYDATEYTIASIDASGAKDGFRGGDAFRPTFNSFMFANARALSRLAALAGDTVAADAYARQAAALKARVQTDLWHDGFQHFVDRFKADNAHVHYWDFIRGRELAGYVPWAFALPDDQPKFAAAWQHLLAPDKFAGPHGLRTVEPGYEHYMRQYRYAVVDGVKFLECQWNGPSWPFDTTLVLQALANLLNNYTQDVVHADAYVRLLKQYARQHFLRGEPDLQEDYDPDTGAVIVGLPRSHHYNHSGFNDLVITGLVGLRPRADDTLEINPLLPTDPQAAPTLDHFCLENVPYHGHLVTIVYDRDGRRYGQGVGLQAYVDGRRVIEPAPLGRRTAALPAPQLAPAVERPVNLAVNFARENFPAPAASVDGPAAGLWQAVDGRVWFFSNVRNYWTNAGSAAAEDWFSLDFGTERRLRAVALYFYGDGAQIAAPAACRVQCWRDGAWSDIADATATPARPIANGENTISFSTVATTKLRLVFTNPQSASVALVEVKAFE